MTELDRLQAHLKRLALPTIAQILEDEAAKAAKAELSYTAFLARLLDEEIAAKADRSVSIRISKARFPVLHTFESFDFTFQPSLPAARLRELAELGFLAKAENLVLVGRPGTGKTHLATALGLRACQARKRVQFVSASDLVDQLLAAEVSRTLAGLIEGFGRLDLVIIDELGYLPMDAHRATLFFQLISHLYTRTSVIITSNVAFDGWGRLFGGDEVIASAILDRLLHFAHTFLINGPSFRMKDKPTTVTGARPSAIPEGHPVE